MIKKLIEYGFSIHQVQALLSNNKLDTCHGMYYIKNDKLYLGDRLILDLEEITQ